MGRRKSTPCRLSDLEYICGRKQEQCYPKIAHLSHKKKPTTRTEMAESEEKDDVAGSYYYDAYDAPKPVEAVHARKYLLTSGTPSPLPLVVTNTTRKLRKVKKECNRAMKSWIEDTLLEIVRQQKIKKSDNVLVLSLQDLEGEFFNIDKVTFKFIEQVHAAFHRHFDASIRSRRIAAVAAVCKTLRLKILYPNGINESAEECFVAGTFKQQLTRVRSRIEKTSEKKEKKDGDRHRHSFGVKRNCKRGSYPAVVKNLILDMPRKNERHPSDGLYPHLVSFGLMKVLILRGDPEAIAAWEGFDGDANTDFAPRPNGAEDSCVKSTPTLVEASQPNLVTASQQSSYESQGKCAAVPGMIGPLPSWKFLTPDCERLGVTTKSGSAVATVLLRVPR